MVDSVAGPWRILVTDSLHAAGVSWLEERGVAVEYLPPEDRTRLFSYAARVDALIIRTATTVTGELFEAAPRVRVVGRAGTGLDNVDVAEAETRGVRVVNAPEANTVSAAEHTFALMLAVARGVAGADRNLKRQRWEPGAPLGLELHGRTLGIVGFGRIGQRVAALARAFGMSVLINDPVIDQRVVERIGVRVVPSLDDLLPQVDLLTVHTPLDATTHGLIDRARLALLPRHAIVINCARGGIVQEQALLDALEQGQLRGAGLDVLEDEPPLDYALVSHPRVVATPHWGAHTEEAKERVGVEIAQNVFDALGSPR